MTLLPLLAAVVAALVAVTGTLVTFRQLEARVWRRRLVAFGLRLPSGLSSEDCAHWLATVAALTLAPRGALLASPPIVLEAEGTSRGIDYRLLVPEPLIGAVLSSIGAVLPGVRVERLHDVTTISGAAGQVSMAAGLRLAGRYRQLAVERAGVSARTLTAALQPVQGSERVVWQWIVTGAGTPPPISGSDRASTDLPWWLEEQAPADADGLRAARLKQRQPLLLCTGRLLVQSPSRQRAAALFGRAWGGVRLMNVPGSRLVRDVWSPRISAWQLRRRWLPSLGWPLRLNAAELAGCLPLPVGEEPLPGLPASVSRQVPAPVDISRSGTVLADSTYVGAGQPLRIGRRDRLMHVALLGPTGTGKSTLMVNMALQDVLAGDGLALLDPKADMAADLLERIPKQRRGDVIVINPADLSTPVGFNPLATSGGEHERELAVDHVLHVFREVWADSWGPRSDAVLRSSLMLLTHARASDGTAFTLYEIPRLLNDQHFRRWLIASPQLPASVREFWNWFEQLSSGERTQVIGPVMNKLSALTQRTPLRLILGQSQGIDLGQVIRERKLLIMPLSRGLIGAETAALLSSLMVASLWQAMVSRVRIPQAQRRPFYFFIDEAAQIVKLPVSVSDIADQARGLGCGLVLAGQRLSQFAPEFRQALLATVRSQIVFQVEADDARVLARSFAPTMTETDLRSLPAHEVAMRLAINGQTSRPMTGLTRPLPGNLGAGDELRAASRSRYGQPRAEVEAALQVRAHAPRSGQPPVGQRRAPRRPS